MQYFSSINDFPLSRICFGGASVSGKGGGYGLGDISDGAAIDLINTAFDMGINSFDTAPIYGFHQSEKYLGKALKDKREKVFITSKAGVTWHENMRVDMSNDPKIIQRMLEDSLWALDTEYIDLYMIHWPDKRHDIRHALEVLENAKNSKKIKYIGLCNTTNEDLISAKEVCTIDFVQSECNLFNNAFEALELDNETKMGWGTFDKGILTGKLKPEQIFDKSDCRSWAPWWKKSNWKNKVKKVSDFEKSTGLEVKKLAISYALKMVEHPIIGARSTAQLENLLSMLSMNKFETENIDLALKALREKSK